MAHVWWICYYLVQIWDKYHRELTFLGNSTRQNNPKPPRSLARSLFMHKSNWPEIGIELPLKSAVNAVTCISAVWDRLIFNMGIPILVRRHRYIEMDPRISNPEIITAKATCHNTLNWFSLLMVTTLNITTSRAICAIKHPNFDKIFTQFYSIVL